MDERRVQRLQQEFTAFAAIHEQVLPIVSSCAQDMKKNAEAIDHAKVCSLHRNAAVFYERSVAPEQHLFRK